MIHRSKSALRQSAYFQVLVIAAILKEIGRFRNWDLLESYRLAPLKPPLKPRGVSHPGSRCRLNKRSMRLKMNTPCDEVNTSMHVILPPHINLHSRASDHVLVASGICMARAVNPRRSHCCTMHELLLTHHTRQPWKPCLSSLD